MSDRPRTLAPTAPSEVESSGPAPETVSPLVRWFREIGMGDTHLVGGKAASLGEMYQELVPRGVRIPDGFATTVAAYDAFLSAPQPPGTWDHVTAEDHMRGLRSEAARRGSLRECLTVLFADAPTGDHLDMHGRTALARRRVGRYSDAIPRTR